MMARYGSWALAALAAGIVLVGPGIRDNLARPLFLVLGLAAVLVAYALIARARAG